MLNKNIFCASDPTHILDALWSLIVPYKNDFSRVLIFLPSNRAIRSVERMIVDKIGHAVLLPDLIPLGSGVDDEEDKSPDVISNQERIILLAKLLSADANVRNIATALPLARDFIRMQDYLENEGVNIADINWSKLIDEKYATHFQNKARILDILKQLPNDKLTSTQKRNNDIRNWINKLDEYDCVIVCGSTGSVPATADLMCAVANNKNGNVILSGKISGRKEDFELDTNPYNSENKFLQRLGLDANQVNIIDVGQNTVFDTMNIAFGNSGEHVKEKITTCKILECARESEEAVAVAEIAKQSTMQNKSVLVITPDAAANQRIKSEMMHMGIDADFSSGISGTMTNLGRSILNLFDFWIENEPLEFENLYKSHNYNLFDMLVAFIDNTEYILQPDFITENEQDIPIWQSIKNMSDILCANGIVLNIFDARAFISDAIGVITIRPVKNDNCNVCVLGTIESRMQMADVIILTGLNEGMFPTTGYENAWLPRNIARQIGMPSPNRKVSLMALDFMTLSCANEVYWLRSKQSGGILTTESRFLSRVRVATGEILEAKDILESVRKIDDVKYELLDSSAPTPPIDQSDIYVTDIELLIHNPYAFYVKHILRLRPKDDYWVLPDARKFGTIVHDVIEKTKDYSADVLIKEMDIRAKQELEPNSILFYFWHKRFCEITPFLENYFKDKSNVYKEITGSVRIMGRNVRARADMIMDGIVADIKTGSAPTKKQLIEATMPQIPLEAYIMQSNGFPIKSKNVSVVPILQFLQLKKGDVNLIEYSDDTAQSMIDASLQKVKELFGQYSSDKVASYEYRDSVGAKYHEYDDLARVDD